MAAVNRFYDSYYFRPRVAWRIVRNACGSSDERKRLYHEAVEFLRLRAERLKYVRSGLTETGQNCPSWQWNPLRITGFTRGAKPTELQRYLQLVEKLAGENVPLYPLSSSDPLGNTLLPERDARRVPIPLDFPAWRFLLEAFQSAAVWLGISSLLILFFICYMLVLSWADYSYVLPASAASYVSWRLLGSRTSAG